MATGRLRRLGPANARFARRRVGRPDREPTPAARARLAARYPACMPAPASDNVLSPSQLKALARRLLEDAFPLVLVEGEIGTLARPAPGHIYLQHKRAPAHVRFAPFTPKRTPPRSPPPHA